MTYVPMRLVDSAFWSRGRLAATAVGGFEALTDGRPVDPPTVTLCDAAAQFGCARRS
jgi:hypothetical protein